VFDLDASKFIIPTKAFQYLDSFLGTFTHAVANLGPRMKDRTTHFKLYFKTT
jgi:hypothetical protein